jgi:hypothetical protein
MEQSSTPKPLWKKWWFWLAVVVALGVIGRLSGGDETTVTAEDKSGSASTSPAKMTTPTADVEVSAETYFSDYEGNELAADAKYKDKVIKITGKVNGVRKTLGTVYIDLESSNQFLQVYCSMKDESEAASVSKGSLVTLIGVGGGKTLTPTVDDCVLSN